VHTSYRKHHSSHLTSVHAVIGKSAVSLCCEYYSGNDYRVDLAKANACM